MASQFRNKNSTDDQARMKAYHQHLRRLRRARLFRLLAVIGVGITVIAALSISNSQSKKNKFL